MKTKQDVIFSKTMPSGQEGPRFPEYSDKERREKTFESCSKSADPPMTPGLLASYGLFATDDGKVRCFYCGAEFLDWNKGNNLMPMHPECPYAKMAKTKSREEKTHSQQDEATVGDVLKTAAAQSCLQNGCSKEQVSKAIVVFESLNGHRRYSGTALFLIIQESGECPQSTGDSAEDEIPSDDEVFTDEAGQNYDEEELQLRDLIGCSICSGEYNAMMSLPWQHINTCPICFSQTLTLPRYSALAMFYLREFAQIYDS